MKYNTNSFSWFHIYITADKMTNFNTTFILMYLFSICMYIYIYNFQTKNATLCLHDYIHAMIGQKSWQEAVSVCGVNFIKNGNEMTLCLLSFGEKKIILHEIHQKTLSFGNSLLSSECLTMHLSLSNGNISSNNSLKCWCFIL